MLPVLLLHGAGMDGSGWDVPVEDVSLIAALARHGSHTFALDFRGYGRSSRVARWAAGHGPASSPTPWPCWSTPVPSAVSAQAVLVGESLGSGVATAVAERCRSGGRVWPCCGFIYRTIALTAGGCWPPLPRSNTPATATYARRNGRILTLRSASPAVTAWHQAQFGAAFAYPIGTFTAGIAPLHQRARADQRTRPGGNRRSRPARQLRGHSGVPAAWSAPDTNSICISTASAICPTSNASRRQHAGAAGDRGSE